MVNSLVTISMVLLVAAQSPASGNDRKNDEKKSASAPEEQAAPIRVIKSRGQTGERETMILRLAHAAASEVAKTIQLWAATSEKAQDRQPMSVVPMASNNLLLVTGTPKQLAAVRGIVQELDQPTPQIHVKMAIVELTLSNEPQPAPKGGSVFSSGDIEKSIGDLKQQGELRTIVRSELIAHDSVPAFVQLGARVPRIVGTTVSSRGSTNSVQLENIGTILSVTARVIDNELITLEIELEHSHIGPQDEGMPIATSDKGVIRAPELPSLTLRTTVSVPAGKTVSLGGMVQKSENLWRKTVVLLQPEIVR